MSFKEWATGEDVKRQERGEVADEGQLQDSEFMGYLMAALFPLFGVMVGCALIVRGNERGASIVGWSALSSVVWAAVLVTAWSLWLRSSL